MVTIRLATDEDLPAILEIYNDIIIHTTAVFQYAIHTPEMRKEWFETKKEQGFPVFVALEGILSKKNPGQSTNRKTRG
jgi:L-amino acid N-acyltransferase YncA